MRYTSSRIRKIANRKPITPPAMTAGTNQKKDCFQQRFKGCRMWLCQTQSIYIFIKGLIWKPKLKKKWMDSIKQPGNYANLTFLKKVQCFLWLVLISPNEKNPVVTSTNPILKMLSSFQSSHFTFSLSNAFLVKTQCMISLT